MKRRLQWIGFLLGSGILVLAVDRFVQRVPNPRAPAAEPAPDVSTNPPSDELSMASEISDSDAARREAVEEEKSPARSKTVKNEADAWRLRGDVRNELGHFVAGIQVTVAARLQKKRLHVFGAETAHDGTFLLILPEGEWELTAEGDGDRRSPPLVVEVPAEESVTLVLPRSATLAGIVVDTAGKPLVDAKVYIQYAGKDVDLTDKTKAHATTDASGGFRIAGALAGRVELAASSPEHPASDWIEVSVAPGEYREGLRIELGGGGPSRGRSIPPWARSRAGASPSTASGARSAGARPRAMPPDAS